EDLSRLDSPLYIAAASLNRRQTKFAKSRWDVDEYWLKSLFFRTSPPHFFRPPPISRSFRQLPGMKGERDENYESENNQSSQLIAVGRGGSARGSGNRDDSHRRLEQATVVGAIFRQGADSVIYAGGDMAAIE